jgi:hypothetical protein
MNAHDRNKTTLRPKLAALCAAAHGERRRLMDEAFWPDAVWHAPHPLPGWTSLDRLEAELWRPLKLAFPDLERRDDMVFAGRFRDDDWVTCHGHYLGNFAGSWLGIPATGGIGSNRGIPNYRRCHQIPFLTAFPDRVGGNHRARFADGNYVASTGWPSVSATFAGDYLGVKAPNRRIGMRVMDWWRVDGGRLKENWVLIDIPDLLRQAGFDVFAHLQVRSA